MVAPRVPNTRVKVSWDEEEIEVFILSFIGRQEGFPDNGQGPALHHLLALLLPPDKPNPPRHVSSALCSVVRRNNLISAVRRDKLLHSVLSYDHSKLYSDRSRAQTSGTPALPFLTFIDRTYTGAAVLDDFYDTLTTHIFTSKDYFTSNPIFIVASTNLQHILRICQISGSGLRTG